MPRSRRSPLRRLGPVALAGSLLVAAAGCGGDDEPPEVTVTPLSTTTSSPAGASTTAGVTAPSTTVVGEATTTSSTPADLGDPTLSDRSTVSTVGLDTVTFGMTVRTAEAAAGTPLLPDGPIGDCYTVTPEVGPAGVTFTVDRGTIERVDVSDGAVTTRSGLGIGTPQQRIVDAFPGQLTVEPTPTGARLTFTPTDEADQQFRVIFETDGTAVVSFRAGRVPLVEPATPCA